MLFATGATEGVEMLEHLVQLVRINRDLDREKPVEVASSFLRSNP